MLAEEPKPEWLGGADRFDAVLILNVLDRCKDPFKMLQQAKALIGRALPSLQPTLTAVVKDGYDTDESYLGFCSDAIIVINLRPLLRRKATPPALRIELALTVAHEIAHLPTKGGAHDTGWRSTYDELIAAIWADAAVAAPMDASPKAKPAAAPTALATRPAERRSGVTSTSAASLARVVC